MMTAVEKNMLLQLTTETPNTNVLVPYYPKRGKCAILNHCLFPFVPLGFDNEHAPDIRNNYPTPFIPG
jgi:hypothetical protein